MGPGAISGSENKHTVRARRKGGSSGRTPGGEGRLPRSLWGAREQSAEANLDRLTVAVEDLPRLKEQAVRHRDVERSGGLEEDCNLCVGCTLRAEGPTGAAGTLAVGLTRTRRRQRVVTDGDPGQGRSRGFRSSCNSHCFLFSPKTSPR